MTLVLWHCHSGLNLEGPSSIPAWYIATVALGARKKNPGSYRFIQSQFIIRFFESDIKIEEQTKFIKIYFYFCNDDE